jgi:hypothetical protein
MGFDEPSGRQGVHGRVRLDLGRVDEQLLAPDEPGLKAHLDDPLEEAAEYPEAVAFPYLGEAGVIREAFVEVVAQL